MTKHPDPHHLSQAELDDYLDDLVRAGQDDSPEFHRAYAAWEKLHDQ